MKRVIKHVLRACMKKDFRKIKKKIDQKKIISFDIFDTLIERDTKYPEDIFDIVQQAYSREYNLLCSDFRQNRIAAESIARKQSKVEEITLEEIYASMRNVPQSVRNDLFTLECMTEVEHSHIKAEGKMLYEYARKNGRKIILVSDMYLGVDIIETILRKNGYRDYNRLFVSSQYRLKKRTGRLFQFVMREIGCNAEEMLHIGDNPISDGWAARLSGITSVIL